MNLWVSALDFMTDFTKLKKWYKDNIDDNFDDLDVFGLGTEHQTELYDFGRERSSRPDLAGGQLVPILGNYSGVADDLLNYIVDNKNIDKLFEGKSLPEYSKIIEQSNVPEFIALSMFNGKNLAKEEIRQGNISRGYEFLRKYSPQTLGGITRQELRRTEGIRTLFNE